MIINLRLACGCTISHDLRGIERDGYMAYFIVYTPFNLVKYPLRKATLLVLVCTGKQNWISPLMTKAITHNIYDDFNFNFFLVSNENY